ncbi:MAG TPA: hypothetical protein VJ810_41465 [Blastocatellia bacterium]|nr:hypothetical protein [Blastocatellia bacterium]
MRGALAALLVLFGAISPAARLWLPEPVTCGMACCEASGVCSCQNHHTGASEMPGAAARADANAVKLTAAVISRSCSERCAQLPAGFQKKVSIARARIPEGVLSINLTRLLFVGAPRFARDALADRSSVPRAPPFILL